MLKAFLTPCCSAAVGEAAVILGIEEGDEIIMPSYTFVSTANAFVLRGGIPIFCEVNRSTMNMDVNHLKSLITHKTKLIMPIVSRPLQIFCL